jgi:rod shape-determining protein MreB
VPSRRPGTIAIDAGASAIRLWTPAAGVTELGTPVSLLRPEDERSDATAAVVIACRHRIRSQLPRSLRRRRRGFPLVAAVPARASAPGRRRLVTALATLNRVGPVLLMEAPLAAAAGTGLDVTSTSPRVVLDVGVHGSEAAVLAEGRVIDAVTISAGSRAIELAVLRYLFRRHQMVAGPLTAWRALGSPGFDMEGDPRAEIQVSPNELAADLSRPMSTIVSAVRTLTHRAGLRLGTEALEHGIVVVGGGASLPPLLATLRGELGVVVTSPPEPRRAVIDGLAMFVAETDRHPQLWDT